LVSRRGAAGDLSGLTLLREEDGAEWGDRDEDRRRAAAPGHRRRLDAPEVALPAPAVLYRVAVEDFLPGATLRDAQAVVVARDRREVEDGHDALFAVQVFPHEAEDALLGVVGLDPLEALG